MGMSGSTTIPEDQTGLGRRLRVEFVGELADLHRRVASVATKGLQER